ncbi:MAG: hypothetical protein JO068_16925 [Hyphomicrobiales bacterium]|nr:hypothetical protein [Hyphomicrobiales bacterium]
MERRSLAFISCIALFLTGGVAQAGPCTQKDAGSGPTVGANAQTGATGAVTHAHPPTAVMNSMTQGKATSSEDAQRQEQGQPTAAQQAMGTSSNPSKMGEEQGQASATEQAMDTDSQSAKMDQGC